MISTQYTALGKTRTVTLTRDRVTITADEDGRSLLAVTMYSIGFHSKPVHPSLDVPKGIAREEYRVACGVLIPAAVIAWINEQLPTLYSPAERERDAIERRYQEESRRAAKAGENDTQEEIWARGRRAAALIAWGQKYNTAVVNPYIDLPL